MKRTVMLGAMLLWGIYCGYIFSGSGKNLATMGYLNGFYQQHDYSMHLMNAYGADDRAKNTVQINHMIKLGLESSGESLDTLDWLILGQHFAKQQDEEIAFQLYYMAHLMDYERIKTNS